MKNIKIISAAILLLVVILTVGTGQADAVKYSKSAGWGYIDCENSHGSLTVKNYRWKAGLRRGPFEVRLSAPCGFKAGQPTKVVAKFVYRPNTKLGQSNGKRSTYRRGYGKGGASGLSAEIQTGIPGVNLVDTVRKLRAMKPNRARTATFWVNPSCVAVSSINLPWIFPRYPTNPTPAMVAGWGECVITNIAISLHVGKIGKSGHLGGVQDLDVYLYNGHVYPAPSQPAPVQPAPTGPTGDPTGPTGPSEPTGPTGPTV